MLPLFIFCPRSGSGIRGAGSRSQAPRPLAHAAGRSAECGEPSTPASGAVSPRSARTTRVLSSRRTRPTLGACSGRPTATASSRTPSTSILVPANGMPSIPPGGGRRRAAHYERQVAPGQEVILRLRLEGGEPAGERRSQMLRPSSKSGGGRPTSSSRRDPAALSDDARNVMRQALAGHALVQAVVPLRCQALAREATRAAAARGGTAGAAATRVDATCTMRRHLDAGQVGVPLVRGLGPRPSTAAAGAGRRRVRQGAADLALARVVHAPQRPDPGLRVELRRREPPVHAWAAWRVYKIERRSAAQGDRQFLERVFHKLLLNFTWWVNRKDAEGQQRVPGRLSGAGQHRRLRPQRPPAHGRASSISRTGPPGWACTA